MEIEKLHTATLAEALASMNVGETRLAPDSYTPEYVRKICAEMKNKGFVFQTSCRTGVQTVTRLK